jgi:transcription initiation factor TFIID subunit TAF12
VNTDALIWIIIVAVTGVGSNIVSIIVAFRRRPSLDAQFADATSNQTDHVSIHRRISELRDEADRKFVAKEFLAAAENNRTDDRKAIFKQLHELTIAVSDLAARLDERRTK